MADEGAPAGPTRSGRDSQTTVAASGSATREPPASTETSTAARGVEIVGLGTPGTVTVPEGDSNLSLRAATAIAVSPNGLVAVGDSAGHLSIVDPTDPRWGSTVTIGSEKISGVEFVAADRVLTASGAELRWWDVSGSGELSEATVEAVEPLGGVPIAVLAVSGDGRWVAAGSGAGHVTLTELAQGPAAENTIEAPRLRSPITALAIGSEARTGEPPPVVIGTDGGAIVLFDEPAVQRMRAIGTDGPAGPITSLLFVEEDTAVLRSGATRPIRVDLSEGSSSELDIGTESGSPISTLALMPDEHLAGPILASAGSDRESTSPSTASIGADPTSASARGVVWLWNAAEPGVSLIPGRGFASEVTMMEFMPDSGGLVALVRGQGVFFVPFVTR